jgi:CRP-like cAMP-binding protein
VLSEKIKMAKQFALFAEVIPAELDLILGAAREKRFDKRETIFSEGDPVRHVTMVVSGIVKVTQMGLNGNEVILRLDGAGEIVALVAFASTLATARPSCTVVRRPGVGRGSV